MIQRTLILRSGKDTFCILHALMSLSLTASKQNQLLQNTEVQNIPLSSYCKQVNSSEHFFGNSKYTTGNLTLHMEASAKQ